MSNDKVKEIKDTVSFKAGYQLGWMLYFVLPVNVTRGLICGVTAAAQPRKVPEKV